LTQSWKLKAYQTKAIADGGGVGKWVMRLIVTAALGGGAFFMFQQASTRPGRTAMKKLRIVS
jgi:hypothetical protein